MLINASSMFEFHMLVVAVILFYILELIMEIVHNYPTKTSDSSSSVGVILYTSDQIPIFISRRCYCASVHL
jgi:hypothetical protein